MEKIFFKTLSSSYFEGRGAKASAPESISGRVDRASATEAVDSGLIPGRVKSKTIKIGIHSFPV